jgi:alpha-tubulin suppressor-like RCC1 family protein
MGSSNSLNWWRAGWLFFATICALIVVSSPRRYLFTWGDNRYGQVGDSEWSPWLPESMGVASYFSNDSIAQVGSGASYIGVLTTSGKIFMMGRQSVFNSSCILGTPNSDYSVEPVELNQLGQFGGESVTKVVFSSYHVLAVTATNRLISWGSNGGGACKLLRDQSFH